MLGLGSIPLEAAIVFNSKFATAYSFYFHSPTGLIQMVTCDLNHKCSIHSSIPTAQVSACDNFLYYGSHTKYLGHICIIFHHDSLPANGIIKLSLPFLTWKVPIRRTEKLQCLALKTLFPQSCLTISPILLGVG